jgi:hypothetical protein
MRAVIMQENLDRIDELSLLVAGCAVFIFILSEGCLESPFCRQELSAAVAADVPVVLITKEGARWPDAYGALSDTFPSARLIDEAFTGAEEPCRSVFKSKAIQHSNEYFSAFSTTVIKRVQSAVADSAKQYPKGARAQAISQRRRLLSRRFKPQPAPSAPAPVAPPEVSLSATSNVATICDRTTVQPMAQGVPCELSTDTSPALTRLVPCNAQDGAMVSMLTTMSRQSHDLAREQGGQLLSALAEQNKQIGQFGVLLTDALASQAAIHAKQMDAQAAVHAKQMDAQASIHAKQMEAHAKQIEFLARLLPSSL